MNELKFLDELTDLFKKLPGVGAKTALRYAYFVVEKYNKEDIEKACDVLKNTIDKVHKCPVCGMLTTLDKCEICNDYLRDNDKVLVVKDPKDLLSIEKTNQYNGKYHVLGGLISAFEGITPDKLNIESLEKRVKEEDIKEVIIATSLTPQGDVTSLYIEKILEKYDVSISRIGYGLPAGSDLEYADELTIKRALEYRIRTKKED